MMIKFAFASIFLVAAVSASFSPPQFMQFMEKNHPEMLSKLAKRQTAPAGTPKPSVVNTFLTLFTQTLDSINAINALGQKTILGGMNSAVSVAQDSITGVNAALDATLTALTVLGDFTQGAVMGTPASTKKREAKPPASVVAENRVLGQLFASSAALVGKTVTDAQKQIINIAINAGESTEETVDQVTSFTLDFYSTLAGELKDVAQNLLVAATSPSLSEYKEVLEQESQAILEASQKISEAVEPLEKK